MTIAGLMAIVVLALAGVPIFLSVLIGVIVIMIIGIGVDPVVPMEVAFNRLSNIMLLAIPLFILMGNIIAFGGSAKSLMKLMNAFLGHLPGGPAYAVIIANVMVAAMCSSSLAGIAAFGPVMIPLLVSLGYGEKFSYGLVISSAALAPLIPPSLVPIFYSYIVSGVAESPVPVLSIWTGSIFPGLVFAGLLALMVFIYSRRGHFKKLPAASWAERRQALKEGWAIMVMPLVVLGPLYIGWTDPTESAAVGLTYVVLISIFIYRGLNLRTFWQSCGLTVKILGAIFVIVMGAVLLNIAASYAQIPQDLSQWLTDLGLNWWLFIFMVLIAFLLMGMFLDPSSIVLISVPLLVKSVESVGISLITFGVFTTLAVELAGVTPPYGMTLFASQSIMNKPYAFIVSAVLLFIPIMIIGLLLIAYVPGLTTWLPAVTGR